MAATTPRTRTVFYVGGTGRAAASNDGITADPEMSTAVYLDTDNEVEIEKVLAAVSELQSLAGYGDEYDVVVVRGSIFRRARSAFVRGMTSKDVADRLTKIERAVEVAFLASFCLEG